MVCLGCYYRFRLVEWMFGRGGGGGWTFQVRDRWAYGQWRGFFCAEDEVIGPAGVFEGAGI